MKNQLQRLRKVLMDLAYAGAFGTLGFTCVVLAGTHGASHAGFLRYEIVAMHPHDVQAFTQGLAFLDGQRLLESTGRYGRSALWLKDLRTGAVIRHRPLEARQFGEGVAVVNGRLVQLTWQSGLALVYDTRLKPVGQFRYPGEGWGLAFDGQRLLMSDGTARLTFRHPDTFAVTGTVEVREGTRPVTKLNELEYAGGLLYANLWQNDRIAAIDPHSGAVRAWLDLAPLRARLSKPTGWNEREHVLNGIAFNPDNGHFYVTGKCWPVLFELNVERLAEPAPDPP